MEHHELRLPAQLSAVVVARHWTTRQCAGHVDEDTVSVVELLTTELVTNAILHGLEPFRVEVDHLADRVHIGVVDASPQPPLLREVDADDTGGRGIALVDMLATAWGYEAVPDRCGKVVWFECLAVEPSV